MVESTPQVLLAQLRHKLSRAEETSEDLLTSNVFGAFKYSGDLTLLGSFLAEARFRRTGSRLTIPEVRACEYRFWPWLRKGEAAGCEPDVVLLVEDGERRRVLIGIEAKYRSGKSSRATEEGAPTDQLAREWLALRAEMGSAGADRFHLVYLTADFGMPCEDIDESLDELDRKCVSPGDVPADIAWLSFRRLPRLLAGASASILRDLRQLMHDAVLVEFEGVPLPPTQLPSAFEFHRAQTVRHLVWPAPPAILDYAFASHLSPASRRFTWPPVPGVLAYKFELRPAFRWPLPVLPPSAAWSFSP